ncbi:hypothetical protein MVEN_02208800 [Mycena venus]|uniref:Uncharacterized protein n=1 Tax=Mycena venus TaxID=2733690 RepID=A0A8H6X7B5_9AGAR|nr:hypothetical protein MVEN_02208800 [Mycena venus]
MHPPTRSQIQQKIAKINSLHDTHLSLVSTKDTLATRCVLLEIRMLELANVLDGYKEAHTVFSDRREASKENHDSTVASANSRKRKRALASDKATKISAPAPKQSKRKHHNENIPAQTTQGTAGRLTRSSSRRNNTKLFGLIA